MFSALSAVFLFGLAFVHFVLVLCYSSLTHGNKHEFLCYSLDARLACEMPILSSPDNGSPVEALFRSLSQASQYVTLLLAVPQRPRFLQKLSK